MIKRLFSVDPGITRTAVAVFDAPDGPHTIPSMAAGLLDVGLIKPPPKDSAPDRYGFLADGIREVVRKWRKRDMEALVEVPSYAGRYSQWSGATYGSIAILNRAIGALIAALTMESVPVREVEASKVSKAMRAQIVNAAMKKAGHMEIDQADQVDALYYALVYQPEEMARVAEKRDDATARPLLVPQPDRAS